MVFRYVLFIGTLVCTQGQTFDTIAESSTATGMDLLTMTHYSTLTVGDIDDHSLLKTYVETPYFAMGNRPLMSIASISSGGCLDSAVYGSNFNGWPTCTTMKKPSDNGGPADWASFETLAFADQQPSTFDATKLVDAAWNRFPVPPTDVNGFSVATEPGVQANDIKYSMTTNVGSLKESCGITPTASTDGNSDNYDVKFSTTTFYKDDAGALVTTCEEQDIEVSLNHHTDAVASFNTIFGLSANIQKVNYESCSAADCTAALGPKNDCATTINGLKEGNQLLRRLVVTYDMAGADVNLLINEIHTNPENCYGFGALEGASTANTVVIDNANDRVIVKTACMNMLQDATTVDCDTFKTCTDHPSRALNYGFTMDVIRTGGQANGIAMAATLDWTQCPAYTNVVRNINMDSEIDFFKGQADGSGVANVAKTYSTAEELMISLTLPDGSDTGAHNLRIKSIVACQLDTDVSNYAAKLDCIVTGNCAPLGAEYSAHTAGCTKYTWPGGQNADNPITTQYNLLHDYDVTQTMYASSRCKTSKPTDYTTDTGQCKSDKCGWTVAGKTELNNNIWDAFKISTGPFLRSQASSWIIDVTGDVEFCDVTNRRRLLRAVTPLLGAEGGNTIQLRADDKHASSESAGAITFVVDEKEHVVGTADTHHRVRPRVIRDDSSDYYVGMAGTVAFLLVVVAACCLWRVGFKRSEGSGGWANVEQGEEEPTGWTERQMMKIPTKHSFQSDGFRL